VRISGAWHREQVQLVTSRTSRVSCEQWRLTRKIRKTGAIPDLSPSLHQQQHCESRPSFCLLTSTRPADKRGKYQKQIVHKTPDLTNRNTSPYALTFTTCCCVWTNMNIRQCCQQKKNFRKLWHYIRASNTPSSDSIVNYCQQKQRLNKRS